jgi:arylsulfatase A
MFPRTVCTVAVGLSACLLVTATTGAQENALAGRPNVLLIITDDQGYGDLSIHGNPHLKTPHIDRIGKEGVRFDRFYVNSFCAPTRAALLTGRYPLRCGVWGVTHNKEAMRPDEVTLAEALRAAGYRTACVGKWHNGEQYPYTPPGQGFDEFLGFHNGHINNYFDTTLIRGATPEPTRGYISDVLTDEAIRFMEKGRDRPFFCYLAFNAPHSPFQVPDRYFDRFKAKGLDERVAAYYGMCANIDDNVGRLLAALEKNQLDRNTIVVFLTDNGGTAGVKVYNAGMRGGKTSVHEGGTRVPLFVRWPAKLTTPRVVNRIAAHIDLYPTLLDLCGVTPPKGPARDGVSLRPLLEGREADWPERVLFTHNPISETNRYPGAVRTEQYRLVREVRGPAGGSKAKPADKTATPWQLYDMKQDPGQTKDLAAELPEVVARLSRLYEEWYDDIARGGLRRFPLPVGHPEENPVILHAPQAYFSGSLRFASGPGYAHDHLTGWTDAASKVWFEIDVARAGEYELELRYGCPTDAAGSRIKVTAGESTVEAKLPAAEAPRIRLPHRDEEGHQRYVNRAWGSLPLGRVRFAAGPCRLTIEAASKAGEQVMDFKEIVLRKVE